MNRSTVKYLAAWALILGALSVGLITLWIEQEKKICTQAEQAEHKSCPERGFFSYLLVASDTYNGAIQALAAIVVAAFTGALLLVSRKQSEISSEQVALAKSEQRPWIKLSVAAAGEFKSNPNGSISFPLIQTIENVGKSPAASVLMHFQYLSANEAIQMNPGPRGKFFYPHIADAGIGQTIFPGERATDGPTQFIYNDNNGAPNNFLREGSAYVAICYKYAMFGQIKFSPFQTGIVFELRRTGQSTFSIEEVFMGKSWAV